MYAYHVFSPSLHGFVNTIFGHDMKTEIGVVIYMYLKHSPEYIDFKYIWIHGSNSLGSSVFANTIFDITSLTQGKEEVGPSPYYSESEVVYAYQVLDL